jgi:hypothetical protein
VYTPDPGRAASPATEPAASHRSSADPGLDPCDFDEVDLDEDDLADLDELSDLRDPDDLDDLDLDDLDDLDELNWVAKADDKDEPSDFFAVTPPGSPWIVALRGDDPPLTAAEQLGLIRDGIERLSPTGTSPVWVRIFGRRDPVHGRINPEWAEMESGLDRLMGWKAPPRCQAIAIAAGGNVRAVPPDDDDRSPAAGTGASAGADQPWPTSGRVHTVFILDREGRMSVRTTFPDGSTLESGGDAGRLPDALRRCFGLATAPPSVPSSELLERMWLGKVAAAAAGGAVALSWQQVRRLHPTVDALKATGLRLNDEVIDAAMRIAPEAWSWDRIRTQAAEGSWDETLVPADVADWMDEGMFSRWVLEGTRTVADLLEDVLPWLSPSARRRLKRALG